MAIDTCPHVFRRFTIQGRCAECDPDLHETHAAHRAVFERAFVAYRASEGKEPLDDWYAFERWVDARGGYERAASSDTQP